MVSAKNKCIESLVILANVSYILPRGHSVSTLGVVRPYKRNFLLPLKDQAIEYEDIISNGR